MIRASFANLLGDAPQTDRLRQQVGAEAFMNNMRQRIFG
jgi:hypothetical protein